MQLILYGPFGLGLKQHANTEPAVVWLLAEECYLNAQQAESILSIRLQHSVTILSDNAAKQT